MANLTHLYGPEGLVIPKLDPKTQYTHTGDPREAFADEILSRGMTPPRSIKIGEIQRFAKPGKGSNNTDAWLIYREFDDSYNEGQVVGNGKFGYWGSEGMKTYKFCSKDTTYMSAAELKSFTAQREEMAAKERAEMIDKQQRAAIEAQKIIEDGVKPDSNHRYLRNKKIRAYSAVQDEKGRLIVPVHYGEKICSVQRINPNGSKFFLPGGRAKGGYLAIPGNHATVYVTEGYATACSIREATGSQVYVSFTCHGLYEIATHVKSKYPNSRIIVAGDNDHETVGNPGFAAASNTAKALGIECKFPTEPHVDFNDMHVLMGLDAVKAFFEAQPEVFQEEEDSDLEGIPDVYKNPPGILGDIASHYHMTAAKYQPGFAVQTALATVSVLVARVFRTNKNNFSSMYFLNVGKSTVGKEHAKTTMENILIESELYDTLVAGEGYTAAGAVITALLYRPRHIVTIDEFAKYLQACQNKMSGGNMAEAISILMQSISRNAGRLQPKNYSGMGLTNEKQRIMNSKVIHRPANTLLCMTTPDDLFRTISVDSIKDGFIGRFIVCVSEAKRSISEDKEPMPVPDNILHWISAINERRGSDEEVPGEVPEDIVLTFTSEANKLVREFDQWCIDKMNTLEGIGMDALPGRSKEMAMKMSLIVALAKDPEATKIDETDVGWSIDYVKYHLSYMIKMAKRNISNSSYEADKKDILKALRRTGKKGVERKEMNKIPPFASLKKKDLDEILEALVDADLVFKDGNIKSTSGRGRPALLYRASA